MTEHHRTFGCSGITDADAGRIEHGVREAERSVAREILAVQLIECIDVSEKYGLDVSEKLHDALDLLDPIDPPLPRP